MNGHITRNQDKSITFETTHFGHMDKSGKMWNNAIETVPECCFDCRYYEDAEEGEFGDLLNLPYCEIDLVFPVKLKKCTLKERPRGIK